MVSSSHNIHGTVQIWFLLPKMEDLAFVFANTSYILSFKKLAFSLDTASNSSTVFKQFVLQLIVGASRFQYIHQDINEVKIVVLCQPRPIEFLGCLWYWGDFWFEILWCQRILVFHVKIFHHFVFARSAHRRTILGLA